jgi:hypothetical protein
MNDMPVDKRLALEQIDVALERYHKFCQTYHDNRDYGDSDFERDHTEVIWCMTATLNRLSMPRSPYRVTSTNENELAGVLKALRADWDAGYLQTFQELVHGATFAGFLEMAEHLLNDGFKDAAAVIVGGVLEQHLRKLCSKNGVSTTFTDAKGDARPKKLDTMNSELAKQSVYGKNDHKQITAWAQTRNDAAHANYAMYTAV